MKDLDNTASICILCNQEKTPDGVTTNGVFNCITCGNEWILKKKITKIFQGSIGERVCKSNHRVY